MTLKERRITFAYGLIQTACNALDRVELMLSQTGEEALRKDVKTAFDLADIARTGMWRLVDKATDYEETEEGD